MKSREFCYWLNGFFELQNPKIISEKQTELIKKHLDLVFYHEIDPSYSDDPDIQNTMNNIHSFNGDDDDLVRC